MDKRNTSQIVSLKKLKILDEIREVFYQNTGLIVSFHYPVSDKVDFYPLLEKNTFCKLLQSTKTGLNKCLESDRTALENAKRRNEYCIYTCHAGLTNVVVSLDYKKVEIGSIYTGQILTEYPTEEKFDEIYRGIEQLGLRYDLLKNAFMQIKVVEKEKLLLGIKLLSLMADYIISVEDEKCLQHEVYGKDRDIIRHENEKIKLQNELQHLSIAILEYEKELEKTNSIINAHDLKNDHIILKAQLFIKANYHKTIKLSDVANAVYLSPNYFSTIFKELSGYTFSHYLMKTRISVAEKMLSKTKIPIKEVVFKVGFDDYNYFNRQFKKLKGMPPAKFRKLNQVNSE